MSSSARAGERGRLLVLVGIDGAGKSTLLPLLQAARPHWVIGSYDPAAWLPAAALPHLAWMLERDPREVVGRLPAAARASFLGHLVLAHGASWLQPRLARGATVVMDSFFFRFWAREHAAGGAPGLLEAAAPLLPTVDRAVLLEVPPEFAAARKDGFDASEVAGRLPDGDDRAAFVAFQREVAAGLREACRRWARRWSVVSGTSDPERVARAVVDAFDSGGAAP